MPATAPQAEFEDGPLKVLVTGFGVSISSCCDDDSHRQLLRA
jgi:hypothetical protein